MGGVRAVEEGDAAPPPMGGVRAVEEVDAEPAAPSEVAEPHTPPLVPAKQAVLAGESGAEQHKASPAPSPAKLTVLDGRRIGKICTFDFQDSSEDEEVYTICGHCQLPPHGVVTGCSCNCKW